ncbi:MAG TPA: M48 family metalloprotease [Pirellulales bacterium]|nr:M48 family metalloprotease [Pirellulales bacterium]
MNKPYYIAGAVVLCVVLIAIAMVHYEASETRNAIREVTRPDPQQAVDSASHAVDRVVEQAPKVNELLDSATKAASSLFGDHSAPTQNDRPGTVDPASKGPAHRGNPSDGSNIGKLLPPNLSDLPNQVRPDRLGGLADQAFDLAGKLAESADTAGQQSIALSPEDERAWGKRLHDRLVKQQEKSSDPEMQIRIERLAKPLIARTRKDMLYTFTILNVKEVNAFSTAGGYVYLNQGLMKFVADDAELQFVLGHEIGHVELSHCSTQIADVAQSLQIAMPDAGAAARVLPDLLSRPFTKDQEFEADAYGLRAIQRAGRSADSAISFLRRLGKYADEQSGPASPADKMAEPLGSHFHMQPPAEERIRRLQALSSSAPNREPSIDKQ